ncbi:MULTISPECIES: hypothetical protein [Chryseobacterium]|uniref:Uncharacterized protein n=1 Tax=Chryseobacterium taihuense TaxID=1141221 RepID=A0A4U8WCE7_9FLAO|nr:MULTISPECIES: hypothetical protein [Chryseobacterium]QQV02752.1 hypothetical protein I6I61_17080 [Chryseobacterium sp. FDAARGOS 1104]VFB03982.1 Uncharacterised protein [Chryseobacterium taihuense]
MEKNNYNIEVSMEDAFYTIPRNEIENEESGYENFLNEIENFSESILKMTFLKMVINPPWFLMK